VDRLTAAFLFPLLISWFGGVVFHILTAGKLSLISTGHANHLSILEDSDSEKPTVTIDLVG
jgi:hypothetical protein